MDAWILNNQSHVKQVSDKIYAKEKRDLEREFHVRNGMDGEGEGVVEESCLPFGDMGMDF